MCVYTVYDVKGGLKDPAGKSWFSLALGELTPIPITESATAGHLMR